NPTAFAVCLLVVLLAGLRPAVGILRGLRDVHQTKTLQPFSFDGLLRAVMCLLLAMNVLCAFTLPWEYDVQEYHLGAPAQFFRASRIFFLEHNVYASFPENVEMLYLLCMVLAGSTLMGAYAGNLVNVGFGLLTAVTVAATARRFFNDRAGNVGAFFFYACPFVTILSGVAYVEMGMALYLALAVHAFLAYRSRCEMAGLSARKWLVLSGLMAGLAIGCKYPALLFLLLPLLIGVAAHRMRPPPEARGLLADSLALLLTALLAASPWFLKNVAFTGNPTYPLLYSVFGGRNWSPEKDAKFRQAHAPGEMSFQGFAERAADFCLNKHERYLAPVALVFIPLALLGWQRHGAVVAFLAAYWVLYVALWFGCTHRIDRFLAPSIPLLAILSAAGFGAVENRLSQGILKLLAAALLALSLVQNAAIAVTTFGAFTFPLGLESEDEFFKARTDFSLGYEAMKFINKELPPDAKALFVGEARTFYCERPFVASIVFDTNLFTELMRDGGIAEAKRRRITHLLVNWLEVKRLDETYAFTFGGKRIPGYLEGFERGRFKEMAGKQLVLTRTFGQPHPITGQYPMEVYELAE
ncbi:MAG: glycosyltransferase family 39 protein, partial [Planctomycetes bacterium]|nr:glycosyltransferase family 39 protein [Planctomycetota bacterium]